MKPLILVVEDNPHVLMNIKMTLEFNDYEVVTAENGKDGLKALAHLERTPDLILSDIMMPEMDGYDFFKAVSLTPNFYRIPFIFLTAKATTEDVRFGKMLGVDDYITKPYKEEDLLAVIKGKLIRKDKIYAISQRMEGILATMKIETGPLVSKEEKEQILFFLCEWDEMLGPSIKKIHPKDKIYSFSVEELGIQLFQSQVTIYGQVAGSFEAQDLLLRIENIQRDGYLYFNSIQDSEVRGGKRDFLLAVIAPKINYFSSLLIKEHLIDISNSIRKRTSWDIKDFWDKIANILTEPLLEQKRT